MYQFFHPSNHPSRSFPIQPPFVKCHPSVHFSMHPVHPPSILLSNYHLSIHPFMYFSIHLFVCIYIFPTIYPSIFLLFNPYIYHLCIYPSFLPSILLCIFPSIHFLSAYIFFNCLSFYFSIVSSIYPYIYHLCIFHFISSILLCIFPSLLLFILYMYLSIHSSIHFIYCLFLYLSKYKYSSFIHVSFKGDYNCPFSFFLL